jgi:hypothetical protein
MEKTKWKEPEDQTLSIKWFDCMKGLKKRNKRKDTKVSWRL